ncbi:spore coat protein U domain-containing protein [Mesorhizobium sp. WSM4884]|uniref:Csu type fimbrial protein n=1 Tax=Mesorhizobium sp. WSM4884 TaxID=3038542 RepID=UPI00241771CC|nr:spore coat protein U domain-containing protein [Mesorhizobium sp. WSM4884]MDG4883808.1 spore coat protein U domain-containing protein [Mesorhizobium sp. WSM4884]
MLRTIILLAIALIPSLARAQSCSFSVSNMSFSSVDTLSGSQTNSTATISMDCLGLVGQRILICPNLGAGTGGASSANARQMLNGANSLNYQLYSDSARSVVWGTYTWAYASRAPALALTPNILGAASGTATIYGTVFGGQGTTPPGSYLSAFSGAYTEFRYRYSIGNNCDSGFGILAPSPSFTVSATVAPNCLVSTQNIDFGSTGVLDANVDATGQISVTCTPAAAYSVSLNGGTTSSPPTARKMSKGAETVTYGLYRDAGRTLPWGDSSTPGSTVPGTGSGVAQNLTVYGRVPPQATPSAGVYTDTVVVTVTY